MCKKSEFNNRSILKKEKIMLLALTGQAVATYQSISFSGRDISEILVFNAS